MAEKYDYLIKTMLLGDNGVGKDTLKRNYTKNLFQADYKMTIGASFHTKLIELETEDGLKVCKLQLWVMSTQDRFLRLMYYRGSLGAFLMFDLTNHFTFERLPNWINELKANSKYEIPILIIGNKSDLINQRVVSKGEIEQFTKEYNLQCIETSAKTGDGLDESFHTFARLVVEKLNLSR